MEDNQPNEKMNRYERQSNLRKDREDFIKLLDACMWLPFVIFIVALIGVGFGFAARSIGGY
jgi:hypothetical protein